MTSCEPSLNKGEVKHSDSKTNGGVSTLKDELRLFKILWKKINPIMLLPPCGR